MQKSRRIMLFSPPLPPLVMTPDHPVVIGRQAQCDLTLHDNDVSRRHAEVCFEAGGYVLRDLGSTNGTFLNDKEITSPAPLSPGDRIEVGARTLTFCELAPEALGAAENPNAAQSLSAERSPSREAFAGDLSEIPAFAVLQVLELGSRSGLLEIDAEDLSCRIWLREGVPIHAESSNQTGFDAALSIASLERGRFRFEPQLVTVEATIACTMTELLTEGCRLLDEQRA